MITNPTDPDAMEAWQRANLDARRDPDADMDNDAAATVIQSYGDQREADARADEREAVFAWLEHKGGRAHAIDVAMAIRRGEYMKGSG